MEFWYGSRGLWKRTGLNLTPNSLIMAVFFVTTEWAFLHREKGQGKGQVALQLIVAAQQSCWELYKATHDGFTPPQLGAEPTTQFCLHLEGETPGRLPFTNSVVRWVTWHWGTVQDICCWQHSVTVAYLGSHDGCAPPQLAPSVTAQSCLHWNNPSPTGSFFTVVRLAIDIHRN